MTIDLAGLPQKAVPGHVAPDIIWKLAVIDGPAAIIPGLLAAIFYAQYRIDRASYEDTHRKLMTLRAATACVGDPSTIG